MKVDRFKVCIERFLESGRSKQGLLFLGAEVKLEPPFLRCRPPALWGTHVCVWDLSLSSGPAHLADAKQPQGDPLPL